MLKLKRFVYESALTMKVLSVYESALTMKVLYERTMKVLQSMKVH